jgi:hypothetical protein
MLIEAETRKQRMNAWLESYFRVKFVTCTMNTSAVAASDVPDFMELLAKVNVPANGMFNPAWQRKPDLGMHEMERVLQLCIMMFTAALATKSPTISLGRATLADTVLEHTEQMARMLCTRDAGFVENRPIVFMPAGVSGARELSQHNIDSMLLYAIPSSSDIETETNLTISTITEKCPIAALEAAGITPKTHDVSSIFSAVSVQRTRVVVVGYHSGQCFISEPLLTSMVRPPADAVPAGAPRLMGQPAIWPDTRMHAMMHADAHGNSMLNRVALLMSHLVANSGTDRSNMPLRFTFNLQPAAASPGADAAAPTARETGMRVLFEADPARYVCISKLAIDTVYHMFSRLDGYTPGQVDRVFNDPRDGDRVEEDKDAFVTAMARAASTTYLATRIAQKTAYIAQSLINISDRNVLYALRDALNIVLRQDKTAPPPVARMRASDEMHALCDSAALSKRNPPFDVTALLGMDRGRKRGRDAAIF